MNLSFASAFFAMTSSIFASAGYGVAWCWTNTAPGNSFQTCLTGDQSTTAFSNLASFSSQQLFTDQDASEPGFSSVNQATGATELGTMGGIASVNYTAPGDMVIGLEGAQLQIGWYDQITVTSTSLAPGTPITLQLGGFLHDESVMGTVYFTNSESAQIGSATSAATLCAGILSAAPVNYNDACSASSELQISDTGSGFQSTQYTTLQTTVGAVIYLSASALLSAAVTENQGDFPNLGEGMALNVLEVADASQTALVDLNSLTPGVTLTSASGTNYSSFASSVPEPASYALIALALAGFALRLRFPRSS